MLPGPTGVPERVTRAMYTHMINHRSDDFVKLYEPCVEMTKQVFRTDGEAVCLSASGTGAVEASVVNLYEIPHLSISKTMVHLPVASLVKLAIF